MYGPKECFVPIREDASQVIVSYEMVADGEDNAFWHEVYFNKNRVAMPTLNQIKEAIIADINARTDERILSGFVWTCLKGEDKDKVFNVWLSTENEFNFKAAYDLAVQTQGQSLPVKFKMGEIEVEIESEDEQRKTKKIPEYHTFEDMEDFSDFYVKTIAYVDQCLNEGWQRKDSIDWSPYEEILEPDDPIGE
jgi:hypothetical protein